MARVSLPDHHEQEAYLEELGRLHGEWTPNDPPPSARHGSSQQEDRGQADEAEEVQRRRGANEPAGIEAGQEDHDEEAEGEPDELAHDDAATRPADVEARERHRTDHDQPERGRQQQPVDVLQQAPIDPQH